MSPAIDHARLRRPQTLGLLTALLVCVVPAVAAGPAVAASRGRVRVGSAAKLPHRAQLGSTVAGSKPLRLTIALQPRDALGLQSLATAVATPGSPAFRHYLSVPQFARRFGATPAQIAAVQTGLRAQRLTAGAATANGLTIPVTGTAAQIEQAFSVSLRQVKVAGRTAYANAQAPTIGANIGRYVQSVIGLDDITRLQPQTRSALRRARSATATPQAVTGGPQPCAAAQTNATGGYSADVFATAYQFSPLYQGGALGAGQTVALFEQQPYSPVDISTYQACYQTGAGVIPVDVDGGPGPYQAPPGEGDGEAALDIETVIGLAPRANILVYQGPGTAGAPVDILNAIVSQNRAKVISSSWGACESLTGGPVMTSENTILQEAAVQGQSFFISSGDSGSSMCFQAQQSRTELSVISPGSEPFATGVGGTILFNNDPTNGPGLYQPGDPKSEGVWNDGVTNGRASGTGGGISSQWAMPSYQSGAAPSLGVTRGGSNAPCSSASFCREVPDVSADADPNTGYSVFADGQWSSIGGTSAAAPLWASFVALANSSAACRGLPLGFVNPALYQIAGSSYLNNFTDVTLGSPVSGATNNDSIGINGGNYPMQSGFDMATGLGTPIGGNLASTLCHLRAPVFSVKVSNPGTRTSAVKVKLSLKLKATDSGGAPLSYAAVGLPAGLTLNALTGVISGTPTKVKTYTVGIAAGDGFANRASASFQWAIVKPGPPKVAHPSLHGVSKKRAKLTFTIGEGKHAHAIHAILVGAPKGLSFSSSSKTLKKHLVIRNSKHKKVKFKVKRSHGSLSITLSASQTKATITVGYPALKTSSSLASKVKHHKVKTLTFVVKAVDSHHETTKLKLRSKAS